MAPSPNHPERQRLEAFALGRLGSREMDRVEAHLRDCAACGAIVLAAPSDALVALLRHEAAPPVAAMTSRARS
jgi:hypothetical protein